MQPVLLIFRAVYVVCVSCVSRRVATRESHRIARSSVTSGTHTLWSECEDEVRSYTYIFTADTVYKKHVI
jgi:hypothetical protein